MNVKLTDEEINRILRECDYSMMSARIEVDIPDEHREIAKAQLKKVYNWGNEDCKEHNFYQRRDVLGFIKRRECFGCWQALLKEAK